MKSIFIINCTYKFVQVSGEGCGYGVGYYSTFWLYSGTNTIDSVNASESYCEYYSGMVMYSNSHTSYSAFTNNKFSKFLQIWNDSIFFEIKMKWTKLKL